MDWWRRQRTAGLVLISVSMLLAGSRVAAAVPDTQPQTLAASTRTVRIPVTHNVTVRLPGRVIRRVDHVLVVETPRYVFVFRGRRRVILPKIVRIAWRVPHPPGSPIVAAIVGGSIPTTVTVPVTVSVPGPTTTVTSPPVTVTLPQVTTTVTVPTTVTLPGQSGPLDP